MKNMGKGVVCLIGSAFIIKAVAGIHFLFGIKNLQIFGSDAYSAGYLIDKILAPIGYLGLSYLIIKKNIKGILFK